MSADLAVSSIVVGERGRSDLGDLSELAASIEAIGLLHPVVVTASNELVAGERRLHAVQRLGWERVPVTVVDLSTAADALRAELEENTCRKPLSAYEADVIRQRREEVLRPKAKEQQGRRTDLEHSPKLGGSPEPRADRRTAKAAAVGTGYSGSTLDKVRTIRDVAERGIVRQGKAEVPVPEPVRQAAREAVENIKTTGAAVDREHKRVTRAVDQFVQADPDVTRLRKAKAFFDAIGRTGDFTSHDFASLPAVLSGDEWDLADSAVASIERAVAAYRQVRPHHGLRVVSGKGR